ncbi:MAG TPA: hypothetical protein VF006_20475 [Longimicrobium sp.]
MAFQLFARRPGGALFALLLLAACSDALPSGPGSPLLPAPPADALAALSCTAQVSPAVVTCAPMNPAGGAQATILGGQNVNVRLTASNFANAGGVFSMDVTVQNLLATPMGAADPGSVSGVNVFFYGGPASATGAVDVYEPDGEGFFTGAGQPYFHWPEVLNRNGVSQVKRWKFSVSPTVVNFQFLVYVQAELMPLLVFDLAAGGNRDIYRMAMNGSDLLRLTTDPGDDRNPTASQSTVVFATFRHGKPELYSIPLVGGPETRLTTSTASEGDPALSADGLRLAYTSDVAIGVSKVWTANPDGTGAARATPTSFASEAEPEASPAWWGAANRLALVATGNGSADVFDLTLGGVPSLLRGGTTAEVDPAWSPDGTRLVYTSNATGAGDVYMLRLSDSQVTRLTSGVTAESYATWTTNGRIVYLAFLSGATELRWLNPDVPGSGGAIPVTGAPNRPHAVPGDGPA